ncbi:MAG: ABC transporter transmembrane domain-containing protein [Dorea sp.]
MSLAEKMRRLPLSFFGQRDLSDLTTTMMGDCSKLERMFSNAVPGFLGTVIMFIIISCGLLVIDWRMGLCVDILPVPTSALVRSFMLTSKKQIKCRRTESGCASKRI